ncbi:MAG: hypothetical protein JSW39_13015 [Desulfobacterales bacterium]|nr:MAG: hypothetical protein JSW39_13015 [Desulfobacterales bacterium]
MSLWTAIVIIVAIGTVSEIYRARLKANAEKSEESFKTLTQRIARLEERMANLETIVLEKERTKQFSDL